MAQQTYGEYMRSNPPIPTLTAVEWLLEAIGYKQESDRTTTINIHPDCDVSDLVERAKQMEKEQIEKAIDDALNSYGIIKK